MSTRLAAALVALALALFDPATARAQVAPTPPPADTPPAGLPPHPAPSAIAPVVAPPSPDIDPDAALERVLRSGCRQGLPAVEGLIGQPDAVWAETVLRLCRDILRKPGLRRGPAARSTTPVNDALTSQSTESIEARREPAADQEGRGLLVLWSTGYGVWLGAATDLLLGIDGDRAVVLAPLIGLGIGLGLSLKLTSGVSISRGQAWTIMTGFDYGTINGVLWASSFDRSYAATAGISVASSIAAATMAIAVADAKRPRAGTIELIRSSLLWGTLGGLLGLAALGSDSNISDEGVYRTAALTMDLSFLIGLALAHNVTISRNRVLIIDAGAMGGGLTGLGLAWLAVSAPGSEAAFIAAGGLAGMLAGIGIAAYSTRDLDDEDDARAASAAAVPPGVLALHPDGRWRLGAPGPMPVLDGTGHRIVGATLNALSGAF
jgi:hypothetical protein